MSKAKGIGFLALFWLVIVSSLAWQVRDICLLQRDACDYYDLIDTVFSSRFVTIACVLFIGLLIFVTTHVVARLRANTLGIQQDEPPKRQFNINGHFVAIFVFALYLGGSLVILMSAAGDLEPFHVDKFESFMWKAVWTAHGSLLLAIVVWHLNHYFVKPASIILLIILSCVTLGSIYWIVQSALLAT